MNIELRNFENNLLQRYEEMQCEIGAARYMSRFYPYGYKEGSQGFYFYSIFLDSEFIGVVWLEPDMDSKIWMRLGIMIGRSDLHGKGIGRAVIRMCIDKVRKEKDFDSVNLNVRADNERAVNCYAKAGFKIARTWYKTDAGGGNIKCYSMRMLKPVED